MLATVDAYKNSELKKYLLGAYPTVRVFSKGKTNNKSFVGSKPESFVKSFINDVIASSAKAKVSKARGKVIELQTAGEFEDLVAKSQVPVMVKFSASW